MNGLTNLLMLVFTYMFPSDVYFPVAFGLLRSRQRNWRFILFYGNREEEFSKFVGSRDDSSI